MLWRHDFVSSVDSLTEGRISLAGTGGNNTASATGESGLPFRWDYILIYVFLRFLQGSGAGKLLTPTKSSVVAFTDKWLHPQ